MFFFFKQKTAYEMRISDWSSDVCSSDLIIRGRIGFDGLLMSDDLGMHALQGSFADRARGVIDAGCDIALHCSGNMAEMEEVASAVPPMSPKVHDRLERAMASVERDAKGDFADAIEKRDALLALADQPDFA